MFVRACVCWLPVAASLAIRISLPVISVLVMSLEEERQQRLASPPSPRQRPEDATPPVHAAQEQ